MDSEWFDDDGDDDPGAHSEWKRTENDVRKTGYRLGLSAGQEETLQAGFDAGYAEGANTAFAVCRLQGQISASLSILESTQFSRDSIHPGTGSLKENLLKLMEDCAQLQRSIFGRLQSQSHHLMTLHPSSAHYSHLQGQSSPNSESQNRPSAVNSSEMHFGLEANGRVDSIKEITDLLGCVGIQDLPPVRDSFLGQCLQSLQLRYHSLMRK